MCSGVRTSLYITSDRKTILDQQKVIYEKYKKEWGVEHLNFSDFVIDVLEDEINRSVKKTLKLKKSIEVAELDKEQIFFLDIMSPDRKDERVIVKGKLMFDSTKVFNDVGDIDFKLYVLTGETNQRVGFYYEYLDGNKDVCSDFKYFENMNNAVEYLESSMIEHLIDASDEIYDKVEIRSLVQLIVDYLRVENNLPNQNIEGVYIL